jgi:transcription termination factor NusB
LLFFYYKQQKNGFCRKYFFTFATKYIAMANFQLTSETAFKVKTKFLRKYRDLANQPLEFEPGKEDQLVEDLMRLVKRDRTYIEFTIQKALADTKGNRL